MPIYPEVASRFNLILFLGAFHVLKMVVEDVCNRKLVNELRKDVKYICSMDM